MSAKNNVKDVVFAIDCDGVLRDSVANMCKVYNEEFGQNTKPCDLKEWSVEKSFPLIKEKYGVDSGNWYFFGLHNKEVFFDSPAIEGALEAMCKLSKYGTILIVTSQYGVENKELTLEWLKKNSFPYDSIMFSSDKSIVYADYLIDDYYGNFKGCNAKCGVIVTQPHNEGKSIFGIVGKNCLKTIRVNSLSDFVEHYECVRDIDNFYH